MGRGKKKIDSPEDRLTQFFLKSVGIELRLYNASTEVFVDDIEEQGVYQSNVGIFASALKTGWPYDELHSLIGIKFREGVRTALASEIIPKREDGIKERDNLIEPDTQYFHSALYDVTAPCFAIAGSMMLPVSRGSTALKESFTLRHLMDYYFENIKTACIAKRRESQTKTMAWLLGQATLDEILYCIDAASLTDNDVPVVELANYLDEANREIKYHKARSL
jgi:hypothetical protein